MAKPQDNKDGAKVSISFWYEDTPTQRHKLTLHEDVNGIWHPELDLCIHQCGARDPPALLVALADVLHKASLSLCDAEVVVDLVGMVATKKKGGDHDKENNCAVHRS